LKRKCLKWARISHLNIWNTNYGQKKGRESNWQFDPRPLKVKNQPHFLICRRRETCCWKGLDEVYNFSSNFIAIGGMHAKLCTFKVAGVLVVGISGFPFGSPETKSHLDGALVERCKVYYKGERWWLPPISGRGESYVSELLVARPNTKSAPTMH
jgi:hypothetical protein